MRTDKWNKFILKINHNGIFMCEVPIKIDHFSEKFTFFNHLQNCHITFKIDDVFLCPMRKNTKYFYGHKKMWVRENRTKARSADCGFSNPVAARMGGGALIVCYVLVLAYIIILHSFFTITYFELFFAFQ